MFLSNLIDNFNINLLERESSLTNIKVPQSEIQKMKFQATI